jgi:hypothetical protein
MPPTLELSAPGPLHHHRVQQANAVGDRAGAHREPDAYANVNTNHGADDAGPQSFSYPYRIPYRCAEHLDSHGNTCDHLTHEIGRRQPSAPSIGAAA